MPEELVSNEKGCVYVCASCDTALIKRNLETITDQIRTSHDYPDVWQPIVLSSRRQLTCLTSVHGYSQYFVSLCRRNNLLKNDRVTLLSPMDQLIAIQLCLAEKNKEDKGDYDVETSIVLQAEKDINNQKLLSHYDVTSCTQESGICDLYKNFLDDCNYVDACDVFNKVKEECEKNEALQKEIYSQNFIILEAPKTVFEKQVIEFMCQDKEVRSVTVETALDCDDNVTVTCDNSCLATILNYDVPIGTMRKAPSVTDAYVRLVFLSYLDLLVNSRSELSLARVFNVPERELTHASFTDLKHEAKEKKMTMYQTATSFVMKIRLGGKGYAPELRNSALGAHIKGIGEFVTLMHRMDTVLEEVPDIRAACRRTVNIMTKEMMKCRDSKIRKTSVEAVSDQLHTQVTVIIDQMDQQQLTTPDKAACNGGSLTSRRARVALRYLLDKLATVDDDMSSLDHLTDIYSSQRTPLRFPSVLSQFRSPEEDLETTDPDNKYNMSLSERVLSNSNTQQTPIYAKRYKSTLDWAEPVHKVDMNTDQDIFNASQVYVIPTKTIVHAGSKFASGEANKVLESLLDQENTADNDVHLAPMSHNPTTSGINNKNNKTSQNTNKGPKVTKAAPKNKKVEKISENQSKKRPLETETQSSQPQKKKKTDQSKSCRRKLLPPVKGQQSVAKFFRV